MNSMAAFFSGVNDDDDDNEDLCFNSEPLLFIDMLWNMAFVLVSVVVFLATFREKPSTPLRLWISVYSLQCLLHVGFVWNEYRRRGDDDARDFYVLWAFPFSAAYNDGMMKKMEMINTIASSVWWVVGFYWIATGGQPLLRNAPHLYWLSVIFLALDAFFMVLSIVMASFLFLLLFCCFPTFLYSPRRAAASENKIVSLPTYRFTQRRQNSVQGEGSQSELLLQPEDSECCICLNNYIDGAQLCRLPCNRHHFHRECISRWLQINATCPLCKFRILGDDTLV